MTDHRYVVILDYDCIELLRVFLHHRFEESVRLHRLEMPDLLVAQKRNVQNDSIRLPERMHGECRSPVLVGHRLEGIGLI